MHHYERSGHGTTLLAFLGGMVVWAMFGSRIKERVSESRTWQELKREVDEEVSRVKDLTQDGYERIVDEVSGRYSRIKGISQHELRDLNKDLKKHWMRIKDAWSSDRY